MWVNFGMLKHNRIVKVRHLFLFVLFSALAAPFAHGKDLTSRLGVGFQDQFGTQTGLPAVAVRYHPVSGVGISGALGIDTDKDNSTFGLLAKIHRVIFEEQNLNFYMGAGAGLLSEQRQGQQTESGFELMGFGGVEFFFSGLENLGFSAEFGAAVTSIASGVRFRTMADHPFRAGIFFYF